MTLWCPKPILQVLKDHRSGYCHSAPEKVLLGQGKQDQSPRAYFSVRVSFKREYCLSVQPGAWVEAGAWEPRGGRLASWLGGWRELSREGQHPGRTGQHPGWTGHPDRPLRPHCAPGRRCKALHFWIAAFCLNFPCAYRASYQFQRHKTIPRTFLELFCTSLIREKIFENLDKAFLSRTGQNPTET